MKKLLISLAPLYLAACVSAPQQAVPKTVPTPTRSASADLSEYRQEMESAYARIVEHLQSKEKLPIVDADAILSMEVPDHRTVRSAINLFSVDMHDSIQQSLRRSAEYKLMIDRVLDEYGLPRGLAYLPVIESAYLPTLTSRAGARGIWQFMPGTAREYGLRVDWWMDDRTDPEKSTRAAAQMLRDLHGQFGDWSLALAAYNCGPGRVSRTLASQGAGSFWELLENQALPKETRGYVPTFFATLTIVSDPQTYGFELEEPKPIDFRNVDVAGPVSLEYVAEAIGIDHDEVKALNPAFRRGIVPPGKATVRVPSNVAPRLAEKAATLRYDDPYVSVSSFTLRSGDSVAKLAKMLKTSREEILRMNGLSSDRIGEGDSIYLPVRKSTLSNILRSEHHADAFYVVEQGDTLYSIAKRHGLSVEELLDLNQLKESTIQPGMKLRVMLGNSVTAGGM